LGDIHCFLAEFRFVDFRLFGLILDLLRGLGLGFIFLFLIGQLFFGEFLNFKPLVGITIKAESLLPDIVVGVLMGI
jgi:hypothetical protein